MNKSNWNRYVNNVFYAAAIAGTLLMSFYYFLSNGTVQTSAATPKVNFILSPATGTYSLGGNKTTNVILKTGSVGQKISGFDIVIKSNGNLSFWDAGAPKNVNGGNLNIQQIAKTISQKEVRIAYVFIDQVESLPQGITFPLQFYGTMAGQGMIYLDPGRSQVTGDIANHVYSWGKTGNGTYSFR